MEELKITLLEVLEELKEINRKLGVICGDEETDLSKIRKLLSLIETNTDIIAGH